MKLIHIVQTDTWEKHKNQKFYGGDTLKTNGFIHCCLPHQVQGVLEKWFPGRSDLLFLEIDSKKLKSKIIFENLEGGLDQFPHIYGPLNLDAVIEVHPSYLRNDKI